jgi:hypothetical protein
MFRRHDMKLPLDKSGRVDQAALAAQAQRHIREQRHAAALQIEARNRAGLAPEPKRIVHPSAPEGSTRELENAKADAERTARGEVRMHKGKPITGGPIDHGKPRPSRKRRKG